MCFFWWEQQSSFKKQTRATVHRTVAVARFLRLRLKIWSGSSPVRAMLKKNYQIPKRVFGIFGGNNRARTCDPLLVRQMLSQLSYAPVSVNYYNTIILFVKS